MSVVEPRKALKIKSISTVLLPSEFRFLYFHCNQIKYTDRQWLEGSGGAEFPKVLYTKKGLLYLLCQC